MTPETKNKIVEEWKDWYKENKFDSSKNPISFWLSKIEEVIDEERESNKEICICAAVKDQFGNIYRGHRHGDCMMAIRQRGKEMERKEDSQGFITSKNRFVNRREGLILQKEAGIKSADEKYEGGYGVELFSEDLY